MAALRFAVCICLVYFTIFANGGSKPNFSRSNLQALAMDKLESESEDAESGTCDETDICGGIQTLQRNLNIVYKLAKQILARLPPPPASCKELYDRYGMREKKAYDLQIDGGKIPVYCHMQTSRDNDGCGEGGWTLVMKTNGYKSTFHYDSDLWTNKSEFFLPGGKTGFDSRETKLPTYWITPFSKICLGMKNLDGKINFIVINKQADSLYSLIADGQYRATSLGRNTWKTLIGSKASLQINCNKEGFNVVTNIKARIGIFGNNENNCITCDSMIGIGADNVDVTTGNVAMYGGDNGDRRTRAMGYILVQ